MKDKTIHIITYNMNELLSEKRNTLNDFVKMSIKMTGKEYTVKYINYISDLLNNDFFYKKNCKVPLFPKKIRNNGEIRIKKTCPLNIAHQKFGNDFFWASFHPDWRYQFGKIVIRKGIDIIFITRDSNIIRKFLRIPEKEI